MFLKEDIFCHELQSPESISHSRLVSVGDNWNCTEFFHGRLFFSFHVACCCCPSEEARGLGDF